MATIRLSFAGLSTPPSTLPGRFRESIKNVEVAAVTGLLPPKERESRILALAKHPQKVLVCTDCLSEGINLQDQFNAIFHYDLSWNPTRHEQREGRVDRFGQSKPKVRVLTYFGVDNQIDGVVLDVLLRKHKKIKSDLGISVAVPGSSEDVVKALFEGMQLRQSGQDRSQLYLPGLDPVRNELHTRWEAAREREVRSRSRFAQHAIKPGEVHAELEAVREAIGTGPTVQRFVRDVLHLAGVPVIDKRKDHVEVPLSNQTPRALRHAIGRDDPFLGRFDLPVADDVIYLSRTHPIVEGLASYVLETALDEVQAQGETPIAHRCGVVKTKAVSVKTSVLLARFRFHLLVKERETVRPPMLAEEILVLAFTGTPGNPVWIDDQESAALLEAVPSANLPVSLVKTQVQHLVENLGSLTPHIEQIAQQRAKVLRDAHTRVRKSAKIVGRVEGEPVLPADILGCFILLPENQ